jgi:hypothetical protein
MLASSKQRAIRKTTVTNKQGATRKVIVLNNIEQAKNNNIKQTRSNNVRKKKKTTKKATMSNKQGDTPPSSLMDSTTSLKVKTTKGGVRARSLVRNISGLEGCAGASGWD